MSGTAAGRRHSRSSATNLHRPELGNGLGNDSSVKANSVRAAETCRRPASRVAISPTGSHRAPHGHRSRAHSTDAPSARAPPHLSAASSLLVTVTSMKSLPNGASWGLLLVRAAGAAAAREVSVRDVADRLRAARSGEDKLGSSRGATVIARGQSVAGATRRGTDNDRFGTSQTASGDAIGGPSQLRRSSMPPAQLSAAAPARHPVSGVAVGRHRSRSSATNLQRPGLGIGLSDDSSVKANSVRAAETCGRPTPLVHVGPLRWRLAIPLRASILGSPPVSVASGPRITRPRVTRANRHVTKSRA